MRESQNFLDFWSEFWPDFWPDFWPGFWPGFWEGKIQEIQCTVLPDPKEKYKKFRKFRVSISYRRISYRMSPPYDGLVITRHHEGVERWYCSRMKATSLPDLPIPTRSLNSSNRPKLFRPKILYKTEQSSRLLAFERITRRHEAPFCSTKIVTIISTSLQDLV